jgi:hypothetical protein
VQGAAGHPGQQGGGPKKNNQKKEGRRGGEAQGVADPPKKVNLSCFTTKSNVLMFARNSCKFLGKALIEQKVYPPLELYLLEQSSTKKALMEKNLVRTKLFESN